MANIGHIERYYRGEDQYLSHVYQYSSDSFEHKYDSGPLMVAYPKDEPEVIELITFAKLNKHQIAIRTGGHQYSNASSAGATGIIIDVSKAFTNLPVLNEDTNLIETGISLRLFDFSRHLMENGWFVPHGMCKHVMLGGHVQTGGYGMLTRSFGLFSDHVRELRILDNNEFRWIRKANPGAQYADFTNDEKIAAAILGGSPGNITMVSGVRFERLLSSEFTNIASKLVMKYEPRIFREYMNIVSMINDDIQYPKEYNFCLTVMGSFNLAEGVSQTMSEVHPDIYGEGVYWTDKIIPPVIVVYLSYTGHAENPDMTLFDRADDIYRRAKPMLGFKFLDHFLGVTESRARIPVGQSMFNWVFRRVREFKLPYIKRAYVLNGVLVEGVLSNWLSERLEVIQKDKDLRVVYQIMPFGGAQTDMVRNGGDNTSYSYRDCLILVMDCFYSPSRGELKAQTWVQVNDDFIKKFSDSQDKRVFWGSYSNNKWDLDLSIPQVQQLYLETFRIPRILEARNLIPESYLFQANKFAVRPLSNQDQQEAQAYEVFLRSQVPLSPIARRFPLTVNRLLMLTTLRTPQSVPAIGTGQFRRI